MNGLSYLVKIWRIDPLNDRLVLLATLERCLDAEGYQDRASLVGSFRWSYSIDGLALENWRTGIWLSKYL